jgi:hypothetical protein
MITLFENFGIDKIDITKYMKLKDGVMKLPSLGFENFSERDFNRAVWNLNNSPRGGTPFRYASIMRFYLYLKLLRYNGNSPVILKYIEGLKRSDFEIINKIPNNNTVLDAINANFGLNYPDYDYNNFEDLQKFIEKWEIILSDRYLLEYTTIIYEISKNAHKSEKIVKGVMTMLYSRYFEIVYAKLSEDLQGMDLWKIKKTNGARQSIQVKNITGGANLNIKEDCIWINNSNLDLHNYECWVTKKLPYDYIAFYVQRLEKIYIIKSTAIYTIDKNKDKGYIKIKLKNWAMTDEFHSKIFKEINVPKRFIEKDVSKIFYTPDVEQEVQIATPEVLDNGTPIDNSKEQNQWKLVKKNPFF